MIKNMVALTEEMDDIPAALAELLQGLSPDAPIENVLQKHTIGIVSANKEFAEAGTLETIVSALPFPTIGMLTANSTISGKISDSVLSVFVMTSDDVSFTIGAVDSKKISSEKDTAEIKRSYSETVAKIPGGEEAKLIIGFVPTSEASFFADVYPTGFTEASGGVPFFGSNAGVSDSDLSDFEGRSTLLNGKLSERYVYYCIVAGAVKPQLFVSELPIEAGTRKQSVITEAVGNRVISINNKPSKDFLGDAGYTSRVNLSVSPFVVDVGDGAPFLRGAWSLNEEDALVFSGVLPVGTSISIAVQISSESVLSSVTNMIERAKEAIDGQEASCLLMFSCVSRYLALGFSKRELEKVEELIAGKKPYMLSYSDGEYCPVRTSHGKYVNKLHNYSFIACAL
ncbi:hypothetical protein FACS1894111_00670 [Clostridia bacterium]|nr:hypothetical protein FACS1894111_00670 [Clostridia bacterium]